MELCFSESSSLAKTRTGLLLPRQYLTDRMSNAWPVLVLTLVAKQGTLAAAESDLRALP